MYGLKIKENVNTVTGSNITVVRQNTVMTLGVFLNAANCYLVTKLLIVYATCMMSHPT